MVENLRKLAMVIDVAETLHHEGKINKDDYLRLISGIEETYKNPNSFAAELTSWAADLLQMDDNTNHIKNLEKLLQTFLESPDADDYQVRLEMLQMIRQFKTLFTGIQQYQQKELIKLYLKN